MSWKAKRRRRNMRWMNDPRGEVRSPGTNVHHMPPKNPAKYVPIKRRIKEEDHQAWHRLFQNAGTKSQIMEILRRDWGFDHYPD